MGQPLVSIIIPTYNAKDFLPETLASCFQQSYPNIEIIVVDDGSDDGTEQLFHNLNDKYDVHFLRRNHTGSPSAARNVGLLYATGNYIQFLDADDLIDSAKIEAQVSLLEEACSNNEYVVAYCDYRYLTKYYFGPPLIERRGPEQAMHWPNSLYKQLQMYTIVHRFLYPRQVLDRYGAFDETMTHAEDLDLWVRLIIYGVAFIYDERPFALYRDHIGHSLGKPLKQAYGQLKVAEKAEIYLQQVGLYERYKHDIEMYKDDWQRKINSLLEIEQQGSHEYSA